MENIYVIGHKNPDTDSIASALAYAELKNKMGIKVVPKRLGTLNEETKFATKYFNIDAPDVISDARTKLCDIELDKAIEISVNCSCNEAFDKVVKTSTRTLFVCDDSKLIGIVSISDLTSIRLMSQKDRELLFSKSNLEIISSDIKGKIEIDHGFVSNGHVLVYEESKKIDDSVVIVDNEDSLQRVLSGKPSLIIYVGKTKDFKDNGTSSVISTNFSIEDIIRIIYESIPVSLIMTKDMIVYHSEEYIEEIASKIIATRFRCYPVCNKDNKLVGSVSRFHLFNYDKNKFILVDHSSKIQTIDNIEQAEIIEIVDHHHIGDIETIVPIDYRNKTCGCTCSIIYQMYKENNLVPSKEIAGMMLSAIISDTLYFISNTTTVFDIDAANELAKIAGVKLDDYARELISASVNLVDADIDELVQRDLKQYSFGNNKVAIGQTNYNKMSDIQLRLDEFKTKLSHFQESKGYDLLIMMFTSVSANGTMFLFFGPKSNVLFDIIDTKFDDHSGFDSAIISRKQQLVPVLSQKLQQY